MWHRRESLHQARLILGVKYCGGCNPNFDRIRLVQKLQQYLRGEVAFYPLGFEMRLDGVLVINGCRRRCVPVSSFNEEKVFEVATMQDVPKFLDYIGEVKYFE